MNKVLAYLILGATGSGRREVLVDLIQGGFDAEVAPVCYLSADEPAGDFDSKLGTVVRWQWDKNKGIQAPPPTGQQVLFFVTDGRLNPVDQMESFRDWMRANHVEMGRVLCVVNCRLAETRPEILPWYDACIHFSDVVLLSNRKDVSNKWMSEFRERYEKECMPCLFEMVKNGRVKNPALLLDTVARRISQAFEEIEEVEAKPEPVDYRKLPGVTKDTVFIDDEDELEDEEEHEAGDSCESPEDEDEIVEDPYFTRKVGGARHKIIPDITKFL